MANYKIGVSGLATCTKTILVIPDLHAPFEHPDALAFVSSIYKENQPDTVVCLGDEIDAHALSDHEHDPDGLTAGAELKQAIEKLKPFYDLFPKVYVCTSNHTARIFRRAFSAGLPIALLKSYRQILQAPSGWSWKDSWNIDGIIFEHGEGLSGKMAAITAAQANMCPTVIGHIHAFAGIQYGANAQTLFWGFNSGCLIDSKAYAFNYAKKFKAKPIIGCGIIERGVPRFIPMLLNKSGRWVAR